MRLNCSVAPITSLILLCLYKFLWWPQFFLAETHPYFKMVVYNVIGSKTTSLLQVELSFVDDHMDILV
jgi:hypothetical protein